MCVFIKKKNPFNFFSGKGENWNKHFRLKIRKWFLKELENIYLRNIQIPLWSSVKASKYPWFSRLMDI